MKSTISKYVNLYIFIVAVLFSLRVVMFSFSLGGIEMDSGWHLGVARNLAQRGIYASYTNTVTEEGRGAFPSIHSRYSIQDENGYVYFPAAISAGPGYVVPQALLMKLLGYDWWQFRLWPLMTFFGLLLLLFYFVYKLGGIIALLFLHVWLWLFPQIYISTASESYGEHIALFYLLLSFLIFTIKINTKRTSRLIMFFSGLTFSLAVLTKFLAVFAISGYLLIFFFDFYYFIKGTLPKKNMLSWLYWCLGFITPILMFDIYRYLFVMRTFGEKGWQAVRSDINLRFQREGSGLSDFRFQPEFIVKKLNIWGKVGFKYPLLIWLPVMFYPLINIFKSLKKDLYLAVLIYAATISGFLWYIMISPTGWTRHAYISLFLGMILIFSALKSFLQLMKFKKYVFFPLLIILFAFLLNTGLTYSKFQLDQSKIIVWEKMRYANGIQGLPTNSIFSIKEQKQLSAYFKENITKEDRIYYLDGFLYSEVSAINDKVFYPYKRYINIKGLNPAGGRSYLLLGPYQKGRLSLVNETYIKDKVEPVCFITVYEEPSYTLCELKKI